MPNIQNRICLGTVQFGLDYGVANHGGKMELSTAKEILDAANRSNVDMLDTAIAYGDSEECLGKIGVNSFNVITKLPAMPDNCTDVFDWVNKSVEGSVKRIGVENIYGLLLHNPKQLLSKRGEDFYNSLLKLKEVGIVSKIGISIYSPIELDEICSNFDIDIVQAPFNLIDRRMQSSGWLTRLKERDIEVHTRSAFLQGLLLMNTESIPAKFSRWSNLWRKWQEWLLDQDTTALQASLLYPLSIAEIDRVVIGVDNLNQFSQIVDTVIEGGSGEFPDLQCDDELLINPSMWKEL